MRQQTDGENHRAQPSETAPMTDVQVIVAANRGPVQFYEYTDSRALHRQASGGLATAFVSLAGQVDFSWVAVASTPLERKAFEEQPNRVLRIGSSTLSTRYVVVPDHLYQQYYTSISNALLWFAQHYLLSPDAAPDFGQTYQRDWDEGYKAVNRTIAAALGETIRARPVSEQNRVVVMLQDYHLYLVPGFLRAAIPEVALTHFIHIPWPAVRYWQLLPQRIALEILTSLLANDVIGVQTALDVRNLLSCMEELLPEVIVERSSEAATLTWRGRHILVKAYPISIDPAHVRTLAQSPSAQRSYQAISRHFDLQTILRVDRIEPSKNIVLGLHAFALLLKRYPQLRGRVRFVMILVPSRENLPRYRQYAREVLALADVINARYAGLGGDVVVPVVGNDQARALAAMRSSDVMLVNSLIDGMHLGAKEFAVVNERQGVLILSRTAGVAHELGEQAALHITPTDVQETADALYRALTMDATERVAMAETARRLVESHTITQWIDQQLRDAITQAPQGIPTPLRPCKPQRAWVKPRTTAKSPAMPR